jgi:hypothetical protein
MPDPVAIATFLLGFIAGVAVCYQVMEREDDNK